MPFCGWPREPLLSSFVQYAPLISIFATPKPMNMDLQQGILTASVGDVIEALSKARPEAAKRLREILFHESQGIMQAIEPPMRHRATRSTPRVSTKPICKDKCGPLQVERNTVAESSSSLSPGTIEARTVVRYAESSANNTSEGESADERSSKRRKKRHLASPKSETCGPSLMATEAAKAIVAEAKMVKAFDQKVQQFRRDRRGAIKAINSNVVPARAASLCILFETWHDLLGTISSKLNSQNTVQGIAGVLALLFDNANMADISELAAATYLDEVPLLATAHLAMLCRTDIQTNGTTNRQAVAAKLRSAMQKLGAKLPTDITKDEHLLFYADAGVLFTVYPCLRFLFSGSVLEIGRSHASIEKQIEDNKSLSCLLRSPNPIFIPNTITGKKAYCTTNVGSTWYRTEISVPAHQRGSACTEDGCIRQGPCLICNKICIWFPGFCSPCARLTFGVHVVFKNAAEGYGLFAARNLKRGHTLKYEGRIIDEEQRMQEYGGKAFYGAQLQSPHTIVADEYRSLASMANHCESGNMRILYDKFGLIVLEALEDVSEGEELTYEYSDTVSMPTPRQDMYSNSLDGWLSNGSAALAEDFNCNENTATEETNTPPLQMEGSSSKIVPLAEMAVAGPSGAIPVSGLPLDAQLLLQDVQPLFANSHTVLPGQFVSHAMERNSRWKDRNAFTAAYKSLRTFGVLATVDRAGSQVLKLCGAPGSN
jgi:hypothetical protein